MELLWSYVDERYEDVIRQSYEDCPYPHSVGDDVVVYVRVRTWFVLERKNSSGVTVLDEFVDRFVDDNLLASQILKMKDVRYDMFAVLQRLDEYSGLDVRDSNGRTIKLQAMPGLNLIGPGWILVGFVYPWSEDDGVYRFIGAAMKYPSPVVATPHAASSRKSARNIFSSRFMRKFYADYEKAESIIITPESRCDTLLKKLSGKWSTWIFNSLKIKKKASTKNVRIRAIACVLTNTRSLRRIMCMLTDEERRLLYLVVAKGGRVRYNTLCKSADEDDTPMTWHGNTTVVTPVGRLRSYGLLVVGSMRISSRNYKMAVIPADILKCLTAPKFDKKD